MARIRTYETDNTIDANDKILGTDGAGGINTTSNFTVADLKEFIESGINVVLPVPPGYFSVINQEGDDVQVSGIRQDLQLLAVDVNFYTAGDHDGDHDNVAVGTFRLQSNGNGWWFELVEYYGRYYVPSFVGKSVRYFRC